MSNLGLNVSNVVSVQIVMSPLAAATRDFGSLLILGDSTVIDTNERMRLYTSLESLAEDFGTTAPEYKAAALYYGQTPQPEVCYVGRWAKSATAGLLHGAILTTAEQTLSNFTAITSGGFKITVDGVLKTLSGLNFSGASNLNAVAAIIDTALVGASCVWNASRGRFDFISDTTGATSTVATPAAPASGTDIRALLNIDTGYTSVDGIAAETLVSAVQTFGNISSAWYGLYVAASTAPTDDDYIAAAEYIEGMSASHVFGITTQNTAALDSTVSTDLASRLKALGYKRTFVQYSSTSAYAAASILGRAFSVNFQGENTTLTIKFKQEPGVAAETLTETQAKALKAKNCNVFVNYNNDTAIIQEGTMANGYFFDEVHGPDWLQNDIQTAVWNELYTSTTKIPQTDSGVNVLTTTVANRCEQGVKNGLLAPGVWNSNGFGALKKGQTLTTGYYVYAPPVATQSQADREARKAPVIQAATKLAGAFHFSDIIINVNR